MIPSEIEIKIWAKRVIYGTLGSKWIKVFSFPFQLSYVLAAAFL